MTPTAQISALQEQIKILKSNKALSLLDEFLIRAWERNIRLLEKRV